MRESAEQRPRLTHTARGGKRMAIRPRKMSLPHILLINPEVVVDLVSVQGEEDDMYGNMGALSGVTGAGDDEKWLCISVTCQWRWQLQRPKTTSNLNLNIFGPRQRQYDIADIIKCHIRGHRITSVPLSKVDSTKLPRKTGLIPRYSNVQGGSDA